MVYQLRKKKNFDDILGMARILIVALSLIAVFTVSARITPSCGNNEQLGNCGRICEGTCNNPDLSKCAATTCSGNGCQCKEGYLRNEATDLCIPAAMCPAKKCRGDEILATCGKTCEGTCQSPKTPEICSRIKCANQGCRCDLDSGYVRNTDTGRCVSIMECNKH